MTDMAAANPRLRSRAKCGLRPVAVAESLAALRGPDSGLVELPQRLCRSGGRRVFDMSDTDQALDMYEAVLGTARTQAELAEYVNGELLARLWRELPDRRIRQAWEAVHPLLAHPLLAADGEVPADGVPADGALDGGALDGEALDGEALDDASAVSACA